MPRPSKYTPELSEKICEIISTSSRGLRSISKELNISTFSILKWLNENKEFSIQYARAKEMQADFMAEEIIEISDDNSNDTLSTDFGDKENKEWTNRSRLRVDARKWAASKLAPKKYGDKLELSGDPQNPVSKISLSDEQVKDIASKLKDAF
jgi:hypothetical protein